MTVIRFPERLQIPQGTWYRWRAAAASSKGPWPTPIQDAVKIDAKDKATEFDAWGHRKLAELLRIDDDHVVSDTTVYRVLARNGLCLLAKSTGEVHRLVNVRKETFINPPKRRNRLLQADFSEFETTAAGTWNLGGVVDYRGRVNLACDISITKKTKDAIAFFESALAEVETLIGVT